MTTTVYKKYEGHLTAIPFFNSQSIWMGPDRGIAAGTIFYPVLEVVDDVTQSNVANGISPPNSGYLLGLVQNLDKDTVYIGTTTDASLPDAEPVIAYYERTLGTNQYHNLDVVARFWGSNRWNNVTLKSEML